MGVFSRALKALINSSGICSMCTRCLIVRNKDDSAVLQPRPTKLRTLKGNEPALDVQCAALSIIRR